MWQLETVRGHEVRKCRHRVVSYLRGQGLDLGCGTEKICAEAIGIDIEGQAADIKLDLSAVDSLRMFGSDYFDYVFSSHVLDNFRAAEVILAEWWRVLKYGGYLILYCPDPDYSPRVNTEGSTPGHKNDLYWQDAWKLIKGFGNAKRISASRHNLSNEYSWQLIVQKKRSLLKRPFELFSHTDRDGQLSLPRKKVGKKELLIVRYGALGDALWVTPALKELKKQGWYIIYNCTDYSAQVLRENPYIDEFLIQVKDAIPNEQLKDYWDDLGKEFDRVINFSGSVEGSLLKLEGTKEFKWPHNKRHKECNVNYMDRTMERAGFPQREFKGRLPELHFSEIEEQAAKLFRASLKDYFLVVWSLDGSSFHKGYPWTPYVTGEIAKNHRDVKVVTVGDLRCQIIEPRNSAIIPKAGVLTVRQAMLLTKYADLVIGPETGILNAASCYDTPKIVFLSHSSEENLTKYWKNCISLHPEDCPCHPCHRLIFTNSCPKEIIQVPVQGQVVDVPAVKCCHNISPETVYQAFKKEYENWKGTKNVKV